MMMESVPQTLVLVGKTGNGKSTTGNSILGKKKFQSNSSLFGVTGACELETTVLEDGQILNLIDTPGLFYSSADPETNGKEIGSCMKLAIDGIHAVLVVFSVSTRFSDEEKDAISSLQRFFGERICGYMIVVFTGADKLEEDGKTLEDFLHDCPKALKEILCLCGNRFVLFDNKTKDQTKKANQVHLLLSLVNKVLRRNGGEPYFNEALFELQKWTREFQRQTEEFQILKETKGHSDRVMLKRMEKMHVEQLKRTTEMIELMLVDMQWMFEAERQFEKISTSLIGSSFRGRAGCAIL